MTDALDEDAIIGCLLGQAVGDMMGTPMENLSPRRIAKLFPKLDRPAFFFGRGMVTDDTEHACMTAQALLRSGGDVNRFRRSLAWRLRWWFAAGPAGIGLATLKACLKLWLGFPSTRSGVYSAGNGPAMRAAILGICFADDPPKLVEFVRASTRLTHTDLKAEYATLTVAVAAALSARTRGTGKPTADALIDEWNQLVPARHPAADECRALLEKVAVHAAAHISIETLADNFGLRRGISGYVFHTVPVAVFAWLSHKNDFRDAVEGVIRCGGDTDTVAAITGALVGARVGKAGIPAEWLAGYAEWPRTVAWIERLGRELAKGEWRHTPQPAVPLAWLAIPLRNLFFFLIVLGHLVRRLLPPY